MDSLFNSLKVALLLINLQITNTLAMNYSDSSNIIKIDMNF